MKFPKLETHYDIIENQFLYSYINKSRDSKNNLNMKSHV